VDGLGLGVAPRGGRVLVRLIEFGVWFGGAVRLTLRLWVLPVDEWLSSELGRGTRRGVPPGEDAFVPSGCGG
jgi:hypothetical protein